MLISTSLKQNASLRNYHFEFIVHVDYKVSVYYLHFLRINLATNISNLYFFPINFGGKMFIVVIPPISLFSSIHPFDRRCFGTLSNVSSGPPPVSGVPENGEETALLAR